MSQTKSLFIHYEIHICLEIKHSTFCLRVQLTEGLMAKEFAFEMMNWLLWCSDQAGKINC